MEFVNQQYPSKVEMLSEYCNHKELELEESLTDTASLCRGEGRKSSMFVVKKYCLISISSKKLVAWGKGGVSITERRHCSLPTGP